MSDLNFAPDGDTLEAVLTDTDSDFIGICGPIGSGKTFTCCMKTLALANGQAPSTVDGIARTRGAVVRNTFPELKTTTTKTWLHLFPEKVWGRMAWAPPPFIQQMAWVDSATGIRHEQEVVFIALDREEDVSKLLSMDLTWCYINEARGVRKSIVDALTGRVGRYPYATEGGCTRDLIIADTNAPASTHWWAIMSGMAKPPEWMSESDRKLMVLPDKWTFHLQPPAVLEVGDEFELNESAENLKYLPKNYYKRTMTGKTRDWIHEYLCNHPSGQVAGKPVYAFHFSRAFHIATTELAYDPDRRLHIGVDLSGLNIGAVAGQFSESHQRLRVLHEMLWDDISHPALAEKLLGWIADLCAPHQPDDYMLWLDPQAFARQPGDPDAKTSVQILTNEDGEPGRLKIDEANIGDRLTNDPLTRRSGVETLLRRTFQGQPALTISILCGLLSEALGGQYCYRTNSTAKRPDVVKNRHSHVAEAFEYLVLGGTGSGIQPHQTSPTPTIAAGGQSSRPVDRLIQRIRT